MVIFHSYVNVYQRVYPNDPRCSNMLGEQRITMGYLSQSVFRLSLPESLKLQSPGPWRSLGKAVIPKQTFRHQKTAKIESKYVNKWMWMRLPTETCQFQELMMFFQASTAGHNEHMNLMMSIHFNGSTCEKNTQNHRVYCKFRRSSWICFGSNMWKSTCCLVQSVQSQLLLLKAFAPPAAPMFLDHDSPLLQPAPDADATGSLPLPRLEPEPVETAERKPAVNAGDSMWFPHRPTLAHPSNWPNWPIPATSCSEF